MYLIGRFNLTVWTSHESVHVPSGGRLLGDALPVAIPPVICLQLRWQFHVSYLPGAFVNVHAPSTYIGIRIIAHHIWDLTKFSHYPFFKDIQEIYAKKMK